MIGAVLSTTTTYNNNANFLGYIKPGIYGSLVNKNSVKMAASEARPLNKTIRVLVVDDLVSVRESLKIILSLEDDIQVVGEAANGPDAVAAARALRPDVVITDLEMPKGAFDGIKACAQIKQEKLARAVILLTIHSDYKSRQRAQEASCDLFVEKGVSSEELVGQVRRLGKRNEQLS
jgi:DNA-binding NarL/FixJ family response regulator